MKLLLFLMVFVNVYILFRIWTRIRNPRVTDPDPKKVPDPCGSGSTTLIDTNEHLQIFVRRYAYMNITLFPFSCLFSVQLCWPVCP
jgi:hypothetical protein